MRSIGRRLAARAAGERPAHGAGGGSARGELTRLAWVPASALLPLLAFPPLEWSLLGWLGLAPLAAALCARPGSAAAAGVAAWVAAGWGFGLVFYASQFAWLAHAFVAEAGMGWLHFVNFYALLVALLALGPAAVLGLTRWAWLRAGVPPLATLPVLLAAQDALLGGFPFGGVAWGSLAGPQAHTWAARAVVPVLGGAGLVLLLGLVNAGWGAVWEAALRRGRGHARRWWLAGGAWALLTAACAWPAPAPRLAAAAAERGVDVLLISGDLSLATLQAQRGTALPLRYYIARTLGAPGAPGPPSAPPAAGRPRLVIWPESAVPGEVERGKRLVEVSAVGGLLGADLLLGSNAREGGREYNSLYLVQGGVFDFWRYDKQRLVPFGEYVPAGFRWLFPRKLSAGEGDYAAGSGPPVLAWRGTRLGLAICFESILPGHARAAVAAGAQVLVAAANDAWLSPAARRQHLQLTALRGLEVGRDVLLVANRGWSALLRGGQAVALADWHGAPLAVRAALRGDETPWARWGALPLAAVGALLLLAGWRTRRRPPG